MENKVTWEDILGKSHCLCKSKLIQAEAKGKVAINLPSVEEIKEIITWGGDKNHARWGGYYINISDEAKKVIATAIFDRIRRGR